MTSPYLDEVRDTREVIEKLIAAREFRLSREITPATRAGLEVDLAFLRAELAQIARRNRAARQEQPTSTRWSSFRETQLK